MSLPILSACSLVVLFASFILSERKPYLALALFLLSIGGGLFSFVFGEMFRPYTVVIQNDNILLDSRSDIATSWSWQIPKDGKVIRYGAREIAVTMHLQPITDNPKVRRLTYKVSGNVGADTWAEYEPLYDTYRKLGLNSPEEMLGYFLYDFNEMESKKLAEFWNPLDAAQQAKFSLLVENYLRMKISGLQPTRKLADPLLISDISAAFSLE
jgi:hypothetical protein